MRTLLLAAALFPLAASAQGVAGARAALESGRAALRVSPADCREALDSNFGIALRDLDANRYEQVRFFVAGMRFAAALTACPRPVTRALELAQLSLKDAPPAPAPAPAARPAPVMAGGPDARR